MSAAVRALESAADSIAIGTDHEDVNHAAPPVALPTHRRECGSVNGAYVDVVIPPDVPGVPRLICKVERYSRSMTRYVRVADVHVGKSMKGSIDVIELQRLVPISTRTITAFISVT